MKYVQTLSFRSNRKFLSAEFIKDRNFDINFRINFRATLVRHYGTSLRHDLHTSTYLRYALVD